MKITFYFEKGEEINMVKVLNKHFDPFLSLVAPDSMEGEFVIVTEEYDKHAGSYWARSVEGFTDSDTATDWLHNKRREFELKELQEGSV